MINELRINFEALTVLAEFPSAMKIGAIGEGIKMVISVSRDRLVEPKKYDDLQKLMLAHDLCMCEGNLIMLGNKNSYELRIYSGLGNINMEVKK
jgi:hypothetical protein